MSEPKVCPRCQERPRAVSPGGRTQPYCRECTNAYSRTRSSAPTEPKPPKPPIEPKPPKPIVKSAAQRAQDAAKARRAQAIAAGRIHVVADIHYPEAGTRGELTWTVCSCGERFENLRASIVAARFNEHAAKSNGGRTGREAEDEDAA